MTKLYSILKSHGVTIYAVAKAGGWSWQQVAAWIKGSRSMQLDTFFKLRNLLGDQFGIEITLRDLETQKGGEDERL